MNLQQLEYIVAVDTYRHFVTAAENSFVTQATLSMMIKKLEEELGVVIFDRSRQPVIPTEKGQEIINQAKVILQETHRLKTLAKEDEHEVKGELKLGIIPTLAPYLLQSLIGTLNAHPSLKLSISELTTDELIHKLQQHQLDAAILATPLNKPTLTETPLFYEKFVVYASAKEKLMKKKYVLAEDIDVNRLWLLEEGHCLRSQVINLCELKKQEKQMHQLDFETGSIEILKRMVEMNKGITILPELALKDMTAPQLKNIRYFKSPSPVREISLVTYRSVVKKKLVDIIAEGVLKGIPKEMKKTKQKVIVELES